jgi:hypothetical protein
VQIGHRNSPMGFNAIRTQILPGGFISGRMVPTLTVTPLSNGHATPSGTPRIPRP